MRRSVIGRVGYAHLITSLTSCELHLTSNPHDDVTSVRSFSVSCTASMGPGLFSSRRRENTWRRQRLHMWGEGRRSEEHTSELQSLMRISYAVFCLKKKHKIY